MKNDTRNRLYAIHALQQLDLPVVRRTRPRRYTLDPDYQMPCEPVIIPEPIIPTVRRVPAWYGESS